MKNSSFIFTFIVYLIGLSLGPQAAALIFLSYKNLSSSFTNVFYYYFFFYNMDQICQRNLILKVLPDATNSRDYRWQIVGMSFRHSSGKHKSI